MNPPALSSDRDALDSPPSLTARATGVLQERTSKARGRIAESVGPKMAEYAGHQTTVLAEGVTPIGAALRLGSEQLRGQGLERRAGSFGAAADGLDGVARHLRQHAPAELLEQAQRFAKRQPLVVGTGTAVAGLALGRFLKASATKPPSHGSTGA